MSRGRCGTCCGRRTPSTTCQSARSPTASTSRRGSARPCGRCSTAISDQTGWPVRPIPSSGPAWRGSPTRNCGPCAISSGRPWSTSSGAAARRIAYCAETCTSTSILGRGCDVWLNLPRPPLEASGTSGMKSVMNGGLQLSVLDGWWAEAFDGSNGWGLPGEVDHDHHAQDERDAREFNRALAEEVVPLFYDRGADDVPAQWLARVKRSLTTLGPQFSAPRVLGEHVDLFHP